MPMLTEAATTTPTTILSGIGGLLAGISEVLLALGAGVGFLIRSRRNAKQARARAEAAASLAAAQTKKVLEEKLQQQYESMVEMLKQRIADLEHTNQELLHRLFGDDKKL